MTDDNTSELTVENSSMPEGDGVIECIQPSNDNNKKLEFHPLASIFPLMEGAPFEELVADIKEAHGVREKVWLYEGKILDGRNRFRASEVAGVDCPTQNYEGDNPLGFVISMNIKRRHLSPGQLAFVALEIEQRYEAQLAKQRMLAGKKLDPKQKIAEGGQARDRAAKNSRGKSSICFRCEKD